MGYKNNLRIAQICTDLFPHLAGARFVQWLTVAMKWRRTDLALWLKHSVRKPTVKECYQIARLAEEMTKAQQAQYSDRARLSMRNAMTRQAYRAFGNDWV